MLASRRGKNENFSVYRNDDSCNRDTVRETESMKPLDGVRTMLLYVRAGTLWPEFAEEVSVPFARGNSGAPGQVKLETPGQCKSATESASQVKLSSPNHPEGQGERSKRSAGGEKVLLV